MRRWAGLEGDRAKDDADAEEELEEEDGIEECSREDTLLPEPGPEPGPGPALALPWP